MVKSNVPPLAISAKRSQQALDAWPFTVKLCT